MARLIDADKLNEDCEIFGAWDAKIVQEWLNDQPTVDAVEVVRCRDCINSEAEACPDGKVWCWERACFERENNFCGDGKRRESE